MPGPAPRWHFLVTPKWLSWHAFVVFAVVGMLWLGEWQFHRAESGNALSWAYTFEWPVFAVFGVVFWGKTIYDEFRRRTRVWHHTWTCPPGRLPRRCPGSRARP